MFFSTMWTTLKLLLLIFLLISSVKQQLANISVYPILPYMAVIFFEGFVQFGLIDAIDDELMKFKITVANKILMENDEGECEQLTALLQYLERPLQTGPWRTLPRGLGCPLAVLSLGGAWAIDLVQVINLNDYAKGLLNASNKD